MRTTIVPFLPGLVSLFLFYGSSAVASQNLKEFMSSHFAAVFDGGNNFTFDQDGRPVGNDWKAEKGSRYEFYSNETSSLVPGVKRRVFLKREYDAKGALSDITVAQAIDATFHARVHGGRIVAVTQCDRNVCFSADANVCEILRRNLGAKDYDDMVEKVESGTENQSAFLTAYLDAPKLDKDGIGLIAELNKRFPENDRVQYLPLSGNNSTPLMLGSIAAICHDTDFPSPGLPHKVKSTDH